MYAKHTDLRDAYWPQFKGATPLQSTLCALSMHNRDIMRNGTQCWGAMACMWHMRYIAVLKGFDGLLRDGLNRAPFSASNQSINQSGHSPKSPVVQARPAGSLLAHVLHRERKRLFTRRTLATVQGGDASAEHALCTEHA